MYAVLLDLCSRFEATLEGGTYEPWKFLPENTVETP
jgi:hypothetical protein